MDYHWISFLGLVFGSSNIGFYLGFGPSSVGLIESYILGPNIIEFWPNNSIKG